MTLKNETALKRTPVYGLHLSLGAKMVEFAGYQMPVQYTDGVLKEHLWTREHAGLFDVSHMGQAALMGDGVGAAFEALVPGAVRDLREGQIRYTLLLNDRGGIRDDLMATRPVGDEAFRTLFLVVNAACKEADFAHIAAHMPDFALNRMEDRALLALQGPKAAAAFARICPEAEELGFMRAAKLKAMGLDCYVFRSGYTGEDGYEISVPGEGAADFARRLLEEPEVKPVGLGARDSLRLEAGLCLYGHDINENTSPIEAGLAWTIGKRRRAEGGFPGAERILHELAGGPKRLRVGIRPQGRAPAREGVEIQSETGARIGEITSGGFGPTANAPVAMGYVEAAYAKTGTPVQLVVRGKHLPAEVADMPFVPHRYHRG